MSIAESAYVEEINKMSIPAIRAKFAQLSAPALDLAQGSYAACLVGPGWYRASTPTLLWMMQFKGWWGKEIGKDGHGINLFAGGALKKYAMNIQPDASKIDGRPVLRITYPKGSPFPWTMATDELRALDETTLLCVMYIDRPVTRKILSPFLLQKTTSA